MSDILRKQYPDEFEHLTNTMEFIDKTIEVHKSDISNNLNLRKRTQPN